MEKIDSLNEAPSNPNALDLSDDVVSLSYGKYLRGLRENAGISIEQLSSQTRIRADYISALENEDLDALPGRTFARGFIGSICKNLGCNEADRKIGQSLFDELMGNVKEAHAGLRQVSKDPRLSKSAGFAKILLHDENSLKAYSGPVSFRNFGLVFLILLCVAAVYLFWPSSEENYSKPTEASLPETNLAQNQPETLPETELATQPPVQEESQLMQGEVSTQEDAAELSPAEVAQTNPPEVAELSPPEAVKESPPPVQEESLEGQLRSGLEPAFVASGYTGVSQLSFELARPVKIRLRKDGELWRTKDFPEGYLEIDFAKRLEMLIFDAASVNLKVNGQVLGPVGDSGKVRRVTFDK